MHKENLSVKYYLKNKIPNCFMNHAKLGIWHS